MKLHVLNDLHLKHAAMAPVTVEGDALVLAGDIVDGGDPAPLLALTAHYRAAGLPVLYVPGNHEFYGRRVHEALRGLWRACRANGIELLHNRAVTFGGVRFFGSTLWTDYKLNPDVAPEQSMRVARNYLADHTWIFLLDAKHPQGKRCFEPRDALDAHEKALRLMRARLAEPFDGPTVIVTHHGPSPKSVHPKYAGSPANPAFNSDLEHVMHELGPALWLHGHVHDSFDYRVGATRVVANPRGYPRRRYPVDDSDFENRGFDARLVVTV